MLSFEKKDEYIWKKEKEWCEWIINVKEKQFELCSCFR